MRADRLVALVLLLRERGGVTPAAVLARELEVTPRTVLRDIEALSAAGVPVYAERGRHGGFALLPSFGAELTGLSHDEALALVVAGSAGGEQAFGLGPALASAVRKVVEAMPEGRRTALDAAARRLLVQPSADVVLHAARVDEVSPDVAGAVRRAVLDGNRLRLRYCATGSSSDWRTVDPIGLVTVRGRGYLVALRSGEQRTYRLSRIEEARPLDEPADRPADVDLDDVWQQRCAAYLHGDDQVAAVVTVTRTRRDELVATAVAVRPVDDAGLDSEHVCLHVTWQDAEHAEFALWRLAADADVAEPVSLRDSLRDRARAVATHYG